VAIKINWDKSIVSPSIDKEEFWAGSKIASKNFWSGDLFSILSIFLNQMTGKFSFSISCLLVEELAISLIFFSTNSFFLFSSSEKSMILFFNISLFLANS